MTMSTDDSYNGWTNFATWAADLWYRQDPSRIRALCTEALAERQEDSKPQEVWLGNTPEQRLASILESRLQHEAPELMIQDLCAWALKQIDCHQLARQWMADYRHVAGFET